MPTSSEYHCVIFQSHHGTSGHLAGYFDDTLNTAAREGWKFVQAIRMNELTFLLIFERMNG